MKYLAAMSLGTRRAFIFGASVWLCLVVVANFVSPPFIHSTKESEGFRKVALFSECVNRAVQTWPILDFNNQGEMRGWVEVREKITSSCANEVYWLNTITIASRASVALIPPLLVLVLFVGVQWIREGYDLGSGRQQ